MTRSASSFVPSNKRKVAREQASSPVPAASRSRKLRSYSDAWLLHMPCNSFHEGAVSLASGATAPTFGSPPLPTNLDTMSTRPMAGRYARRIGAARSSLGRPGRVKPSTLFEANMAIANIRQECVTDRLFL